VHDALVEDNGAIFCDTGKGTATAVPGQLHDGGVQVDAKQQLGRGKEDKRN